MVFGFFDGAMITVLGIQILTCVDNTKAASALGFTMVIGSVTSLTGPPIAGEAAALFSGSIPSLPCSDVASFRLLGAVHIKAMPVGKRICSTSKQFSF